MAYTFLPFNDSTIPGRSAFAIPGQFEGAALDPTNQRIFVGENGGSAVFVYSATSGRGFGTVNLPPNEYGYFDDPTDPLYDSDNGAVYVSEPNSNSLAVINASSDTVQGVIAVGSCPESLAYDSPAHMLYVADFCSSNLTVVNTTSGVALKDNITVCGGPGALLFDPDTTDLYLTCDSTEEVLVISTTREAVVAHLSVGGRSFNDSAPTALAYDPQNRYIYVADQDSNNISVINSSTESFVGSGVGPIPGPISVLFDPLNDGLLVGRYGSGLTPVFLDRGNRIGSPLPTGGELVSLVLDPANGVVFGVNQGDSSIAAIYARNLTIWQRSIPSTFTMLQANFDPTTGLVDIATPDPQFACASPGSLLLLNLSSRPFSAGRVTAGYGPETSAVEATTGRVFVPNYCSGNVTVLSSAASPSVVGTLPAGNGPIAVAAAANVGEVVVANGLSNNLTFYNSTSLATLPPNVSAGQNPDALAYDPQSRLLFVADWSTGSVAILNITTGAPALPNATVGGDPAALLFDPNNGYVYVANSGSGSITVLSGSNGSVVKSSIGVGCGPVALTIDTIDNLVYSANSCSGTVSVINATNQSVAGPQVAVGSNPQGIAYDPWDRALFVPDYGTGDVYILANAPVITSFNASPSTVEAGVATVLDPTAAGGAPPYQYAYGGLPSGCTSSNVSRLICVPSVAGTYRIQLTVRDSAGFFADASLVLTVSPPPPPPTYAVTIVEVGLPAGLGWSGTINGATEASTTPSLTFQEPNGTYLFTPGLVPGWTTLFSGQTIVVNGSAANATIAWSRVVYQVMFNQTGLQPLSLPPVDPFWVTLNGTEEEGFGDSSVVFSEPNGSYPFVVTPPAGWSVAPQTGTVLVQGQAVAQTLNFSVVIPPLSVNFTYPIPSTCDTPFNVTFSSNVSGGAPPYSYSWNFGDGSPASNQADPTHEFPYAAIVGTTVTLEASGADGAMANHSETLLVHVLNCTARYVPPPTGNASSSSAVVVALAIVTVGVIAASAVVLLFVYRKRQP